MRSPSPRAASRAASSRGESSSLPSWIAEASPAGKASGRPPRPCATPTSTPRSARPSPRPSRRAILASPADSASQQGGAGGSGRKSGGSASPPRSNLTASSLEPSPVPRPRRSSVKRALAVVDLSTSSSSSNSEEEPGSDQSDRVATVESGSGGGVEASQPAREAAQPASEAATEPPAASAPSKRRKLGDERAAVAPAGETTQDAIPPSPHPADAAAGDRAAPAAPREASGSTVALLMPEKLAQTRLLLELGPRAEALPGGSAATDFSGDSGTIGRWIAGSGEGREGEGEPRGPAEGSRDLASGGALTGAFFHAKPPDARVDLKGVLYRADLARVAATVALVTVVPGEARVDALFHSVMQLREEDQGRTPADQAVLDRLLADEDEDEDAGLPRGVGLAAGGGGLVKGGSAKRGIAGAALSKLRGGASRATARPAAKKKGKGPKR